MLTHAYIMRQQAGNMHNSLMTCIGNSKHGHKLLSVLSTFRVACSTVKQASSAVSVNIARLAVVISFQVLCTHVGVLILLPLCRSQGS